MDPIQLSLNRLGEGMRKLSDRMRDIEIRGSVYRKGIVVRYGNSQKQLFPHNTATSVNFNVLINDSIGGLVTVGVPGAPWRFNAPLTGYYHVSAIVRLGSAVWNAGGFGHLLVYVNGSSVDRLDIKDYMPTATACSLCLQGSDAIYVQKDYGITIYAAHTQGTQLALTGSIAENRVTIVYAGA